MQQELQKITQLTHTEFQHYLQHDKPQLLLDLIQSLQNTDPMIRDDFGYQTLFHCLRQQLLTSEQLTFLTHQLRDLLTLHDTEDAVFARSYAALLLADVIALDTEHQQIEPTCMQQTLVHISSFLMYENDTRNFVEGKGWANAIPFGADATIAAIKHPLFDDKTVPKILHGVKHILQLHTVYTHDEDERAAIILETLAHQQTPEPLLIEWVTQVFEQLNYTLFESGYTDHFFKQRTNILHVLKTLYFYLKVKRCMPLLQETLYAYITQWHRLNA